MLVLSLAWASSARAQAPSRWGALSSRRDAEVSARLLESAMALIACATEAARCPEDPPAPDVLWAQATVRLEHASARSPEDLDLRFLHAVSAARALAPDASVTELEVVIASFEAMRARAPGYATSHVAFQLAILRTRAGDMVGAAAEYQRASLVHGLPPTPPSHTLAMWEALLISWHTPITPSSMFGNWAEVTMLAGDAPRAVELFEAAVAAEPAASFSGALARWGLALARDRAGAHQAAVEMACAAIDVGLPHDVAMLERQRQLTRDRWGPFAALHDPDVFFEPHYEIRAYEALGHECLAGRSSTPEGRQMQLQRAARSWEAFAAEGGTDSVWAEAAIAASSGVRALLAH
jgi:hypothetical protein